MESQPAQGETTEINEGRTTDPNICHGFHTEENGSHFCIEHDCFLCDQCVIEHAGHIGCDSVINILTMQFNKWRAQIEKMDDIKSKFVQNLSNYDKLIKKLKQENYNKPVLESRDLIIAYKRIREMLDRLLANVVLFCKKRMVRDVITFSIDLQKVEQRLKELQQGVSVVQLVGQYLPPLPPIDIDGLVHGYLQSQKTNSSGGTDNNNSKCDKRIAKSDQQYQIATISEMDEIDMVEKAIFWSEQHDMDDMDLVLDLFKDSPQDQLILMKIRFEQRIIQAKLIVIHQGKKLQKLKHEVEMLKIAKAYERTVFEQTKQQIQMENRILEKSKVDQEINQEEEDLKMAIRLSETHMVQQSQTGLGSETRNVIHENQKIQLNEMKRQIITEADELIKESNKNEQITPQLNQIGFFSPNNDSANEYKKNIRQKNQFAANKDNINLSDTINKVSPGKTYHNKTNQNILLNQMNHQNEYNYSQSQFSEFDDNLSSVIMNYDNLQSVLNQNNGGRGGNAGGPGNNVRHRMANREINLNPFYHEERGGMNNTRQTNRMDRTFGVNPLPESEFAAAQLNLNGRRVMMDNNNRHSRSNMSSTLYDFLEENESTFYDFNENDE